MGTATNVIRGKATVYFCTAGTTVFSTSTFTSVGYTTDGGFKLTVSRSLADIEVDQEDMPIDAERTKEDHKASFTFAEVTIDNVAKALGIAVSTSDTSSITLYQDMSYAALALRTTGTPFTANTNPVYRTYLYPYVQPDGDVTLSGGEKGKAQSIPVTLRYFKRITNLPSVTDAQ